MGEYTTLFCLFVRALIGIVLLFSIINTIDMINNWYACLIDDSYDTSKLKRRIFIHSAYLTIIVPLTIYLLKEFINVS